jgi:ABC-type uncharacterized transport system ATPase subunit
MTVNAPRRGAAPPRLSVRNIRKRFGAVEALAGVDLDVHDGEIHAILGENGAGKSTLMHVLGGVLQPDAGTIQVAGRLISLSSPRAARAAGIGMVHQHFTLVDGLTVAENLALSLSPPGTWRLDTARLAVAATELASRVGLELSPLAATVAELPVGARQRLEILKALAGAARVTILDEPTAVLTPAEVDQLFVMLRQLRAQGRAVIFITHKLREARDLADHITIMRRGRVVATVAANAVTEPALAEQMIGEVPPRRPPRGQREADGPVMLEVSDLHVRDARGLAALVGVSFEVRAGEILGIAGVDGNGQRELFDVLVGTASPERGRIVVAGQPLENITPRAALRAGIGHIPPDRHREGLVLNMSVTENLILSRPLLDRFSRWTWLDRAAVHRFATALVRQYSVRLPHLDAPVRLLSGGNQQRIVVARQLAQRPRVLVTANPTRGLDIVASAAVADALLEVARAGCAVVLISTDLDEVLELSDRIRVLFAGRSSGPLEPPIDLERLGLLMAGAVERP